MESLTIQATERSVSGKGAAHKARQAGKVPAVAYGRDYSAQLLEVDAKELTRLVERGAQGRLVVLNVNGAKRSVLLKEVQRDPLTGRPLHADFHAVALDQKIRTEVPVTITGEGRLVDRVLVHGAREVMVECLPMAIPEYFEVNVENLEVGESIKAGQLTLPSDVTLLADPETVIVSITVPRAAIETESTEAVEAEADEGEKEEE